MRKKQTIIYLLLLSFLTPTAVSLSVHFFARGEGKLVMNILSTVEEESKEEQKSEKEKEEKMMSFLDFDPSSIVSDKLKYKESFSRFHLLQGDSEFPTPPPKIV